MDVKIRVSKDTLTDQIEELKSLVSEFDFADGLDKVISRFLSPADFIHALFTVESDSFTTSGTGDVVIGFKKTDFYDRLVGAIRTGNVDSLVIK